MLSNGILLGLCTMLFFGLSNAIAKVPAVGVSSQKLVFYRGIGTMFFTFIAVLFFPYILSWQYVLIALLIAVVGYIPVFTYYKALNKGSVGIISPVANSAAIFTVLFSFLFYGELFSIQQLVGIGITIFGLVFLVIDPTELHNAKKDFLRQGVGYALVTCVLWGLIFSLFKIPINALGPILTAFLIEAGVWLVSGIHILLSKESFSLPKKYLTPLFFISFFGSVGAVALHKGIQYGPVGIVSAVAFANPLVGTLYGKIVYNEQLRKLQYVAIGLIIFGIGIIAYG